MYPVETPSPEVGAVSQTFLQGSSLNEVFVCLCGVIQSGGIPALFRWVTSLLKGLITLVRVTGQCLLMFDRALILEVCSQTRVAIHAKAVYKLCVNVHLQFQISFVAHGLRRGCDDVFRNVERGTYRFLAPDSPHSLRKLFRLSRT